METQAKSPFTSLQMRFLIAMGLVMGLRELSMTMLNPFINIYGLSLKWSTPLLCGIALGIYGLLNAVFQIPYGIISDKVGRKPVILVGLAQIAAGLFLAYLAKDIYMLIIARALQGSGAVMAIAYAFIGDYIIDSHQQSRAMGVAGVVVALGAVIATVVGPMLYNIMSVSFMNLGCVGFLMLAFVIVAAGIKEQKTEKSKKESVKTGGYLHVMGRASVLLLSICSFAINYTNSAIYMEIPIRVKQLIGAGMMWVVYTPAIVIGLIGIKVTTALSEKHYTAVAAGSFVSLGLCWVMLIFKGLPFVMLSAIFGMGSFMCMSAALPSAMNLRMEREVRGTANGVMQTLAFLGYFAGSTATGFYIGRGFNALIYITPIALALVGFVSTFVLSHGDKSQAPKSTVID